MFALADRCPHKGGPLSQGIVFGESVACPLHNWCIELAERLRRGARRGLRSKRFAGARRGRRAIVALDACDVSETRSHLLLLRHRLRRRRSSTRATRITGVRGDPDHPSNRGKLCSKGSDAAPHDDARRASGAARASARCARARGVPRERAAGTTALDYVADRFAASIAEHGPDSVAFYVSGQLLTEDYYVFNKLAKGLDRHRQHRHQLAPVHVVGGHRLHADARRRRAARLLRRHRPRRLPLHRRLEHGVRAPGAVPPHRGGEGSAIPR